MEKLTHIASSNSEMVPMRARKDNRGFTLIEIMVVIAIMGVVGGIAAMNMIGWRGERQLEGVARNFMSDMQLARLQAIREAEEVSVVIDVVGMSYQMFVDINKNYVLDPEDRLLRNVSLDGGTRIQSSTFAGNRTRLNTRGRPNVLGTLTFLNAAGTTRRVVINKVGRLRIESP
jgi:type IV fimbrial biogenesis protein FimT